MAPFQIMGVNIYLSIYLRGRCYASSSTESPHEKTGEEEAVMEALLMYIHCSL